MCGAGLPAQGQSAALAGLALVHGGGYLIGSADEDDMPVKAIGYAVGCAVVSVDYRLSPETLCSGPVEDCYAALKWLHATAGELGVDAGRIAIGGASAGGGLAAGLGLLTRDRAVTRSTSKQPGATQSLQAACLWKDPTSLAG